MAKRLVDDLVTSGVSCWLYALDATPGRRTWEEIGSKRSEADKFIILASVQALIRDGVLKEVEEQIDDNPEKIIVVSLDNLWLQPGFVVKRGTHDLKPFLLDRNRVDMTGDNQSALTRLLKGLERFSPQ